MGQRIGQVHGHRRLRGATGQQVPQGLEKQAQIGRPPFTQAAGQSNRELNWGRTQLCQSELLLLRSSQHKQLPV